MIWIFLQTDTQRLADTLNNVVAQPAVADQISLWSLLDKGGFIMYPLYLLFVAAIFVFFEFARFFIFE